MNLIKAIFHAARIEAIRSALEMAGWGKLVVFHLMTWGTAVITIVAGLDWYVAVAVGTILSIFLSAVFVVIAFKAGQSISTMETVPVTHIHGGVHYHLPVGHVEAKGLPQELDLPAQAAVIAFEVEADETRTALQAGVWNVIHFQRKIINTNMWFDETRYSIEETGIYQFDLSVNLVSIDDAAEEYVFRLNTSNRYYQERYTPSALKLNFPVRLTTIADMDAGDTAQYEIMKVGGSEPIAIKEGSYFKGRRR